MLVAAIFRDRVDAGEQLAGLLARFRGNETVVLALPRGGVPVARPVADALAAPLDVLLVRKLGSPRHPEFAVGAIGEEGVRVVDPESVRMMRLDERALAEVERRERVELDRRLAFYRSGRPRLDVRGRRAVIVDDGVATGATAAVACRVARRLGAAEVVLAVPVAPDDWSIRLAREADALVAVATPRDFWAVGRWYEHFDQTTDAEVVAALDRS
jgi:putative phosphoribosyl transferase